jgi:hypothetical protein
MYFNLPYQMWDVKFYYPPAYPIFLTLMGVHHLDTLTYLRIGTLFVGGVMPLFFFLMLRPFDVTVALWATAVFVATFGHALLSTDMMNHHFHGFQLLFMSMLFAWYLYRPSIPLAILLGVAAALANAGRQVTAFIFVAAIAILALAAWIERRSILAVGKSVAILLLSFVAATGALSVARQAALGGPFQYGLTHDVGARTMFIGIYYGPSLYQKQFRPGEDHVFVSPENGPASKRLFDYMRQFIAIADVSKTGLSDTNNKDEAFHNLIAEPSQNHGYLFWWGLANFLNQQDGDRLLRDVVFETLVSQPRIIRYFIWNFWRYLFRVPTLPNVSCVKCVCPPCFVPSVPSVDRAPFMGSPIFDPVAGPGLIAEMQSEHERIKTTAPYGRLVYGSASLAFYARPVLTILLFASVLLARGKTRLLMLYCVAAVVIIGATTSLALPVNGRYQYPALPYFLAGASVAIAEIVRRIRSRTQMRAAPQQA